ncbi:MAG: ABC transporter ATP-binding protein/permease [Steroidobacteraceae bacterium]
MIDRSKEIASATSSIDEAAHSRLVPQLGLMRRALWNSSVRNTLLLLGGSIFVVVAATAYGQIRLNRWNQPFYDALSHRHFGAFLVQLGVFGLIAGSLLILNVAQEWLSQMLSLKLRAGLVSDLVQNWMQPRRAFRLAHAGPMGVNPDQRLHEDARHLTELSATLGIGLLQATLLLAAFVNVLWAISRGFAFRWHGEVFAIPGYMVWAAIVYAGSASMLSYRVGRGLIGRNANRYAREADLRFTLVRVNEHIDAITLAAGEGQEERRIELDLAAVLRAMRRLVTGLTNLTWVTAGYGWFTLVAPIIAASPLYFGGTLSFGGLMMAAGAFNQVQSSLRWFVDNFSILADWRATLLRVANFRSAVITTDDLHRAQSRIEFIDGAAGTITLDHLEIASPDGCTMLAEKRAKIQAGERVMIVGDPGAGKTLLFRALAGLWPWGSGRVARPAGEEILCLPSRAYLPPGTLREVLAYPMSPDKYDPKAVAQALRRLGLERLVPMAEQSRRWDRELSDDEQRSLVLARALLHAPPWLFVDDLFDALSPDTLARVTDVLGRELKDTAIVHVGRSNALAALFRRELHLVKDPAKRRLVREQPTSAADPADKPRRRRQTA